MIIFKVKLYAILLVILTFCSALDKVFVSKSDLDSRKETISTFCTPMPSVNDYSSNIYGVGPVINISLSQIYKNSTAIKMDSAISNNLSLYSPTPLNTNFNTSLINITLGNIQASNISNTIQDNWFIESDALITPGIWFAAAISIPTSCNLSQVQLFHNVSSIGTLKIYIYSSKWNITHQHPMPNVQEGGLYASRSFGSVSNSLWYSYYNSNFYLNNSKTENNTWYIIAQSDDGDFKWRYVEYSIDNLGNDTYSYQYNDLLTEWSFFTDGMGNSRDLMLKVEYSPINYTPKPSQIDLRINNSQIEEWNVYGYSARYLNYSQFNGGSTGILKFNFTTNWPKVSWFINQTSISFCNRNASNNSVFTIIPNNYQIEWSVDYRMSEFESEKFTDFRINFTIPRNWTSIIAYRDNKLNALALSSIVSSNIDAFMQSIECNPSDDYGNNTWILNCLGPNLGKKLDISQSQIDSGQIYYQDLLNPSEKLTIPYTGDLYLEVFNKSSGRKTFGPEKQTIANLDFCNFTQRIAANYVLSNQYGDYIFRVYSNDSKSYFQVFSEITVQVNTKTNLDLISSSTENNSQIKQNSVVILRFNYFDINSTTTGDEFGIMGASVVLKNGSIGLIPGIIDFANGTYQIELNCSELNIAKYELSIVFNKTFYQPTQYYFTFSVIQNTPDNSNWTPYYIIIGLAICVVFYYFFKVRSKKNLKKTLVGG